MTFRRCAILAVAMLCSTTAMAQTHLALNGPDGATVGVPFDVIVSALDPSGFVAGSYAGTVHFTSSAAAVLPANYAFVPGDAGRHTFSVTLNSDGPQTITVTDATSSASAGVNAACAFSSGRLPVTVAPVICEGTTGNVATMPAGLGNYSWHISDGTITSGQGTRSITFTPGPSTLVSFIVTTTQPNGCPGQDGAGFTTVHQLPTASVPATIRSCPSSKLSIPVTLTGTPPFSITWSDGLQQANINGLQVTRQLAVASVPPLKITSVTDAACSSSSVVNVRIVFDGVPLFGLQPADTTIHSGERATLRAAATPVTRYEWYQGSLGDESNKVGTGETFQTAPLFTTTKYWVKAMSDCATTVSNQATVSVTSAGRRRAVGRSK